MIRTLSLVFSLTLLLSASVCAEDSDRHLSDDPSGSLCRQSAYLHGYIHGYESGFRIGDLDIHLGRQPRAVDEVKEYRRVSGYRREFGDSGYFRQGYRQGFRAAYDDAFRGTPYRGISQIRQAAQGSLASGDRKAFDQAVSSGYDAGYAAAEGSSITPSEVQQASEQCPSGRNGVEYCRAYARGFRLGSSDGFVNQHPPLTHTARAVVAGRQ